MKIPVFQVDAFTDSLFSGNPAAVCQLDIWPSDDILQNIALENNLSDTAFFKQRDNIFEIRWFTPLAEVELCGHATLASAHVLFNQLNFIGDHLIFESVYSGVLEVFKKGEYLTLDFPVDHIEPALPPDHLFLALGKKPLEIWKGKADYLLYYPRSEER